MDKAQMKSILIVDDEDDILVALGLLLRTERYKVISSENGNEAIEKMQEQRPELVITDNMMPIMTGMELILFMKESPVFRDIPVIMMSSIRPYPPEGIAKWNAYVSKPFQMERMLSVIHRLIGAPTADGNRY